MTVPLHLDDVRAAATRIAGTTRVTPMVLSEWLSAEVGTPVWLKLESQQVTGSFKARGAANALFQLEDRERGAGVVAVSSGNHGRAVAHVAREMGVDATICLSGRVPSVKVEAIRALGAQVVVAGPDQDDADERARRFVVEDGMTFIHPFDDPRVIAGQGTVALEILDGLQPETVVIPLSGGGLAGGMGLALTSLHPEMRVIGVSQDRGPAMVRSLEQGRLVEVVEEDTLADALAGGLGPDNQYSFDLCRSHLTATALVSEGQIADAMRGLHRFEGIAVEGGGAVGVAAVLGAPETAAGPTVIVISGGNVAPETLRRLGIS